MIKEVAVIILVDILIYLIYQIFKFVTKVLRGYRENERKKTNKIKPREAKQEAKY